MFGHRRRGRDDESPVPSDGFASAGGYEEKTVFSVDGGVKRQEEQSYSANPMGSSGYDYAATQTATERPMVFVLRENNSVYVYEYSDRLEYYVKLDRTMFMFNVVKKQL